MKNRKSERILNALDRADDRYVEEAAPTAAREAALNGSETEGKLARPLTVTGKKKIYGSRIAAAACACVAAGGLVLWGVVGGSGKLVEDPANTGDGSGSGSLSAEITSDPFGDPGNITTAREMPEPFESEDVDVEAHYGFYMPCIKEFNNINGRLMELGGVLVNAGSYSPDSAAIIEGTLTSIKDYMNLYSYITDHDISKEDAEAALSDSFGKEDCLTREQFDKLFDCIVAEDLEGVNKTFASKYAIVIGDYIYTPNWLYTHTHGDYQTAGIAAGDIREKIALYYELGLTEEAEKAFMDKLMSYEWEGEYPGYETVYLTEEELYSYPELREYVPRRIPEGLHLLPDIEYIFPTKSRDYATITSFSYTDAYDPVGVFISFSLRINSHEELEMYPDLKELREVDLDYVREQLYSGGLAVKDTEKAVCLDIHINDPSKKLTAEEVYQMVMSMPAAGNLEASGLSLTKPSDTAEISTKLPTVIADEYYDVQRYPISEELIEEYGEICGFDGENLYFRKGFRKDESDPNSLIGTSLSLYNVVTGEHRTLVSNMGASIWFICADGKYVYYSRHQLDEDNRAVSTNINVLSLAKGETYTPISLESNSLSCVLPGADNKEIWVAVSNEGSNGIMRLDMSYPYLQNGYADEFITMCETSSPVKFMTAYRDGVLFEGDILNEETGERYIYYWDGVNEPSLFFITTHDIFAVGDAVLYTDNIAYDLDDINDFVGVYDLSAASVGFSVQPSDFLAECNMFWWNKRPIACADGMAVVAVGDGIVYDARKGWFTRIQSSGDYKLLGEPVSGGNALVLLEQDDSYPATMDNVYGKVVAVYIVTRK